MPDDVCGEAAGLAAGARLGLGAYGAVVGKTFFSILPVTRLNWCVSSVFALLFT